MERSRAFRVRARGPIACFTRPEMKAERMSYEVMTPSAARGVLEAVLWKPAIVWHIESIAVCAPIQWCSFRRNEVNSRASDRDYFADLDRAQRNTVALRDVDYVISARFEMTREAGAEDNCTKFEEMFQRRLEKGQTFHQPYLGCREFAADVSPAPGDVVTIEPGVDRPLGLVFYDFLFADARRPLFFEARLTSGVLHVPTRVDVLAENGVAESER
jgi:CRISPR-associated protein Cas5d